MRSSGYSDVPNDTPRRVAQVERVLLCDLFDELGSTAPTLAEHWDTHHLAAHLKLREGSPLQQVRGMLSGKGPEAVEQLVAESDFGKLVDEVRAGPPRFTIYGTAKTEQLLNTLEFFIHHEDVRRAEPTWTPRKLPRWAEDQIWVRMRSFAKLIMRRAPVGVVLRRADAEESAQVVKGNDPAIATALPSELALFGFGRQEVADVALTGPDAAVAKLRATTFTV